jgi:deoxyribodipyrimidine photolyase-related protein
MSQHELRLLLGDQLNHQHSWFQEARPDVTYVLMEIRSETDYVRHHVQKVTAFFAAMRHFAAELQAQGHRVRYIRLDDPHNHQSFAANLRWLSAELQATSLAYQLPDEFRLDQQLQAVAESIELPVTVVDSEHFLTSREAVADFFVGKKTYLLESFYRHLRKKHSVLLDGNAPVGGKWNFDASNRNAYDSQVALPPPRPFVNDVADLVQMLEAQKVPTIGKITPTQLNWPISRAQALESLAHFCQHSLPHFGTYQDALTDADPFLFHSRLSFALNTKLLHPWEVIQRSLAEWEQRPQAISLAQVEGFVRQILGWREFIRGVYWAHMPDYATMNALGHQATLPSWFWNGETQMRCLQHTISQSLEYAYAHHIQRLMVTGNFALLAGIHPDAVDAWYLGIYIDAIEWVELPNTRGMSQFADGGLVATKPYCSSANYFKKMGNYCDGCLYNPKQRHGAGACPFNSLYWEFHARHRETFAQNHRLGMVYRTWDKMNPSERDKLIEHAQWIRGNLEDL